jgi:catalase
MKPTLEGRQVAVLIADGSDAAGLKALKGAIAKAGGKCFVVAPKINGIILSDGTAVKPDGQLQGSPSQLFDAVAILLAPKAVDRLLGEGAALQFAVDAFGHLKAIGHNADAQPLLDKAGVKPDAGVTDLGDAFVKAAAKRFWDREPKVRTLA